MCIGLVVVLLLVVVVTEMEDVLVVLVDVVLLVVLLPVIVIAEDTVDEDVVTVLCVIVNVLDVAVKVVFLVLVIVGVVLVAQGKHVPKNPVILMSDVPKKYNALRASIAASSKSCIVEPIQEAWKVNLPLNKLRPAESGLKIQSGK